MTLSRIMTTTHHSGWPEEGDSEWRAKVHHPIPHTHKYTQTLEYREGSGMSSQPLIGGFQCLFIKWIQRPTPIHFLTWNFAFYFQFNSHRTLIIIRHPYRCGGGDTRGGGGGHWLLEWPARKAYRTKWNGNVNIPFFYSPAYKWRVLFEHVRNMEWRRLWMVRDHRSLMKRKPWIKTLPFERETNSLSGRSFVNGWCLPSRLRSHSFTILAANHSKSSQREQTVVVLVGTYFRSVI